MKHYVLFVGGAGARAAEALLAAASAGVLRAEAVQVLLADTDIASQRSAGLLRAKYADYAWVQSATELTETPDGLRPFQTALPFAAWPEDLSDSATLADWTASSETDGLLRQALFDADAARADLRGGMQGRMPLGRTVFAGLLHEAARNPDDPLTQLIAHMNAALDAGEEVRAVLTGSVAEGSGAAGLPMLARHIRRETRERARLGAVLLTACAQGEDAASAREGLAAFADENAVDAVCVLGLPRSSCPEAPADYARLTDWLASYCIDVLLHRPAWPRGLFTVQAEAGPLSWDVFGKAAGRYRLAYGRLMKTALTWDTLIGPRVVRRMHHPFWLRDGLLGWYAHFFRRAGKIRRECLEDAAIIGRLMQVLLLWLGGLLHALPPEMTHGAELTAAREEAQGHYRRLTELAGQLALMDDDLQRSGEWEESRVYRRQDDEEEGDSAQTLRRMDAVKQEIARMRAEQEKLNRRMGGAAMMRLFQDALQEAEEETEELHQRYAEANRRIDHAESIAAPEDQYRITDARIKLERMVRHQQALTAQEALIREDVQHAETDEARYARPALTGPGEGSALFHGRITERLVHRERRLKPGEVEGLYPRIVQPEDGRTLRETLLRIRRAMVNPQAPVVSLLHALLSEAMEG